jgi:hypothetical protein
LAPAWIPRTYAKGWAEVRWATSLTSREEKGHLKEPRWRNRAKGRMKEVAGAFTGDEQKAEDRAQQRKGQAVEEGAQRERPARPRR